MHGIFISGCFLSNASHEVPSAAAAAAATAMRFSFALPNSITHLSQSVSQGPQAVMGELIYDNNGSGVWSPATDLPAIILLISLPSVGHLLLLCDTISLSYRHHC